MLQLAVFTAILGLVAARPSPTSPSSISLRQEPQDNLTDVSVWCQNWDFSSPEDIQTLWVDWGVGFFLDSINTAGQDDWVSILANDILVEQGDTGAIGCGFREAGCLPNLPTCASMTSSASPGTKIYWVFYAVQKLQQKIERAHSNLQDSTIEGALSVSGISELVSADISPPSDLIKYLSAAFGMASTAASLHPAGAGVSAGMSLIADALSLAEPEADEEEGPVDEGALDKALLSIFKAARDGLDDMLALAVGQGSGDYDNLPQFGECEPYACETAIGGFFADGRILMQGEGEDDAFSSAFSWINKKLVDIALQSAGYYVNIYPKDIGSLTESYWGSQGDDCSEYGAMLDDGSSFGFDEAVCVVLRREDNSLTGAEAPKDLYNGLQDDYGMDISDYYMAAWECRGGDATEISDIPEDGAPPKCFFNINVIVHSALE